MPILWNISPYYVVIRADEPATPPDGPREFTDAEAATVSRDIWSDVEPVPPVKNSSNQSGGSVSKRDKPVADVPESTETPVAESPVPEEEK